MKFTTDGSRMIKIEIIKKIFRYFNKKKYKNKVDREIKKKISKKQFSLSSYEIKNIKSYFSSFNVKIQPYSHIWYSNINSIKSIYYIPDSIFDIDIIPKFNKLDFAKAYSDKSLNRIWFSD